jgi:hypothetical protein
MSDSAGISVAANDQLDSPTSGGEGFRSPPFSVRECPFKG